MAPPGKSAVGQEDERTESDQEDGEKSEVEGGPALFDHAVIISLAPKVRECPESHRNNSRTGAAAKISVHRIR